MKKPFVYDLAGIGIGPFNLGLAALCPASLQTIFFDRQSSFDWHPGLLLEHARLQVPFFADLVTPVDHRNRFSYLSYLQATKQLFRFGIQEQYFIRRIEYNQYCQWVCHQLPALHFNHTCEEITFDQQQSIFFITTSQGEYQSRRVVIGIGSSPYLPAFAQHIQHPTILHSSAYLPGKELLLTQKRIALIGSGQSAAEIFYDLLENTSAELHWFTKADNFFPMDYSKFALEKSTPDYINYFFNLNPAVKGKVLLGQDNLYKGINSELLDAIYQRLAETRNTQARLHPCCELKDIKAGWALSFNHTQLNQDFIFDTDAVVLATGYEPTKPEFSKPIMPLINTHDNGEYKMNKNYSIDTQNRIFMQNADLQSHGFNSADLALGPYRNATILNTILGRELYATEAVDTFQQFGIPKYTPRY